MGNDLKFLNDEYGPSVIETILKNPVITIGYSGLSLGENPFNPPEKVALLGLVEELDNTSSVTKQMWLNFKRINTEKTMTRLFDYDPLNRFHLRINEPSSIHIIRLSRGLV